VKNPVIIAVIVFWLIMTALLVYRQSASRLPYTDVDLMRPSESYLILELPGGQRAGYVQMIQQPTRRDDEQGVQMILTARGALNLLGRMTQFTVRGDTWRGLESGKTVFGWRLVSEGHRIAFEGSIDGGRLRAEVRTAGEVIPVNFDVGDAFAITPDFAGNLDIAQMRPGGAYTTDSFDPLTMSRSTWRIRAVREETIEAYGETYDTMLLELDSGLMTTRAWVSFDNELIRVETPVGFTLVRADSQTALGAVQPTDADDLLGFTAIRPTGQQPFRGASRMIARIGGIDDAIAIEQDDAQYFVEDGLLRVAPGGPLDAPMPDAPALGDLEPYLAADPFVQADHPTIVSQAEAIVGGVTDPWEKARRIYEFVFHELDKTAVISFPSALEVLEQREGDCNEHTVLYAALARAVGVPTRIAIGVVWSGELDGFYYHAWPEVFIGQWVWLDPTLGQIPADATHIKLFSGGIETWPRLTAFIGNLEIEVVEIE